MFSEIQNFFKPGGSSILQLAQQLKEKTDALEKYFIEPGAGVEVRELKSAELAELKKNINELEIFKKKFDDILLQSSTALEVYGMTLNKQTGKVENVFSTHKSTKPAFDQSVYNPEDHFLDVIKKGYGLEWARADDILDEKDPAKKAKKNRAGMKRDQASLFAMEKFAEDYKKQPNVADTFVLDLINIRSGEVQLYGPVYDARDYIDELLDPQVDVNQKTEFRFRMGSQLRAAIMTVDSVIVPALKKVESYNHIMSNKEFLALIPVEHQSNKLIVNINSDLILLQENDLTVNKSSFWGAKKTPVFDDLGLIGHLGKMRGFIMESIRSDPQLQANPQVRNGLNLLLAQVDYRIGKIDGDLKRAARATQNKENTAPNPGK